MAEIINKVVTIFDVQTKLAQKSMETFQKATFSQTKAMDAMKNRQIEIRRVMKSTGLSANQAAKAINQLGFTFNKTGKAVDALGNRMKLTRRTMTDMQKTTRRFEMGFLSMMFASMALNRAIGGFLRSAITAYATASGETNNLRKETNGLIASWEFFKFSLVDALTKSAIFQKLVEWTTILVNKMNALSPTAKSFIALSLGALFFLSLLFMIVGQIGLAAGGFQVLGDMLAAVFSSSFLATLGVVLKSFLLWVGYIALAIAVLIVLKGFFFGFDKDFDKWLANWQRGGGIITKIIIGIVRVLHLGGAFIRTAFLNLFDTLILVFQGILNLIIWGVNKLIVLMNKIPGVSIPLIPKVDFGAFDRIANRTMELAANTPTLSNLFTGGEAPAGETNTTSIGEVNIAIDGSQGDPNEIANKILEKLNGDLNAGLDSSNI